MINEGIYFSHHYQTSSVLTQDHPSVIFSATVASPGVTLPTGTIVSVTNNVLSAYDGKNVLSGVLVSDLSTTDTNASYLVHGTVAANKLKDATGNQFKNTAELASIGIYAI